MRCFIEAIYEYIIMIFENPPSTRQSSTYQGAVSKGKPASSGTMWGAWLATNRDDSLTSSNRSNNPTEQLKWWGKELAGVLE